MATKKKRKKTPVRYVATYEDIHGAGKGPVPPQPEYKHLPLPPPVVEPEKLPKWPGGVVAALGLGTLFLVFRKKKRV